MKPDGTPKVGLQFRRNQSLAASVKTSEAVGQTGMPVFLAVQLLGSGRWHSGTSSTVLPMTLTIINALCLDFIMMNLYFIRTDLLQLYDSITRECAIEIPLLNAA